MAKATDIIKILNEQIELLEKQSRTANYRYVQTGKLQERLLATATNAKLGALNHLKEKIDGYDDRKKYVEKVAILDKYIGCRLYNTKSDQTYYVQSIKDTSGGLLNLRHVSGPYNRAINFISINTIKSDSWKVFKLKDIEWKEVKPW